MSDHNFTLLSQTEIDALINFLSAKDPSVSNEVLNQDSIDKLIHLMRNNDLHKLGLDSQQNLEELIFDYSKDLLTSLGLLDNANQQCILSTSQNSETGYLELYAVSEATGAKVKITPACLEKKKIEENDSAWGYSIAPIVFDKVATNYSMKYSEETYKTICSIFATKNYGNSQLDIPKILLPTSAQLLDNLLKENE